MEKLSKEIIEKGKKLFESGKVTKDLDTPKRIYFTVRGTTEKHSVIFEKEKKEYNCDCKFNSLHHKRCSHILACMFKEGV
ncbi:MAG: hypothetical protein QW818_03485 [Candidatus Aenigmatarchaeota archaeon]|nr:hypothetical protein [Candidatus Aenigmarchaeota archaeon]